MFYLDEQTQSYIIFFIAILSTVGYCLLVFCTFVSLITTRILFHKKSDSFLSTDSYPGVSIIKPLMGLDPLLEENIESHFRMQYPKFELLFCFPDDQDPAINLVKRLMEKFPGVDAKIFTGGKEGIVNPMVYNMAPGYDNAKYDCVWISTSRIKASTDIIIDMASKLQNPNVALVHQMPFTTDLSGFAATVEKIYFGCAMARFYPAFNTMGLCCCTGMSYMFKKSLLDELKGLNWYGRYLAEDFFLTSALHEKGHKLVLSAYPAQQNIASLTLRAFKDRMVRWTRLRLNMMPLVAGFLEPLADCIPSGLIGSWLCYHFFGVHMYYFFPIHVFTLLFVDYLQLRTVQNGPPPFSKLKYVLCWVFREFMATFIYLEAILKPRTIPWGKKVFKVTLGGHTTLLTDKAHD
ncbi:ceramide glucosyltransferase-like [Argopecten irradians]|uniref:ceramide glucosyltransferase-like n=1 Tax=Argopecten irradians TaxID=31199 RepID=UPI003722D8A5